MRRLALCLVLMLVMVGAAAAVTNYCVPDSTNNTFTLETGIYGPFFDSSGTPDEICQACFGVDSNSDKFEAYVHYGVASDGTMGAPTEYIVENTTIRPIAYTYITSASGLIVVPSYGNVSHSSIQCKPSGAISQRVQSKYVWRSWYQTTELPPVSSFTALPQTGAVPHTVTLTDTSTNSPTTSSWNVSSPVGGYIAVADGAVSTFSTPYDGTYPIVHTVSNAYGSSISLGSVYAGSATPTPTPTPAPTAAPTPVPTSPPSTPGSAMISWDNAEYVSGDSATITYEIIGPYWAPTQYTYQVSVVDSSATVIRTDTITTQTGTISISELDSSTYPIGTYYALIKATEISTANVYDLNYAEMAIVNYARIYGYVLNGETTAGILGANVTITQSSLTSITSSSATGYCRVSMRSGTLSSRR